MSGQTAIDLPVGQGRIIRFNEPVESVFMADSTIAELQVVAPDVVYVYGVKPGATNLIAMTRARKIQAATQIVVANNARAANRANQAAAPTSTTNLTFSGNQLIVDGQAGNIDDALATENVARSFSLPDQPPINNSTLGGGSQQVNIRVRFAEVARSELQSYGIDWEFGYESNGLKLGIFGNNAVPDGGGNLGAGGSTSGGFKFDVVIEALKRNGLVKILAEPNLTAVSGQPANFLAGGEIPIQVPQGQGVYTVEYKPFGVSLNFTPTVIGKNRIAMHVKPEVSEISSINASAGSDGFSYPSFVVRRVDTTVEVGSGQTFALAGLFQQNMTRNLEKVPVLGDTPILGSLFRSERFQKRETELVVLITPYIVNPVSSRDLATPIDRPARKKPQRSKNTPSMGLIIK
ncbi:type II and III secretion system protein family protein [Ochrobactrum vermis]|uniref:Type II and III secretion system protein family protein n=1 Tax=Ochrobactrum vermis TaxID=1827297 RepID=A0ABU8PGU7_9HYPH|nr:type II and III secretion system protein family protein [Ochrobactrum vermis]